MPLRRTKSIVVVFTASVLLAVAVLQGLDLWWRHDRALEAAEARAGNLALALSEYVRGAFTLTDTALRQLAIHGRRIGGPAAPSSEWLPILEAAQIALPGSGSVSVLDAKGIIRHSTLAAIVGQPRHDNYIFRHLSVNDPGGMVVDMPFASPLHDGLYLLPVGRRLETPDGRFDGLAVSVVLPAAFRDFFRTIDVGAEGAIWVFHPSGVVLFREPSETDPLGEQAANHPVVLAAQGPQAQGLVKGTLTPGGPTYISGFQTLATPSVIVAASLSEHEILADWRAQLRTAGIGFMTFALALFGLVSVLFRQIDARYGMELALAEAQRVEADRLRQGNERLEEALRRETQARVETETASRLKDEFLMTLSHELRTPLNAILGWTRMLIGGALAEDQRVRALRTIERNAQTQARMVEDMLEVSGAITGKLQLKVQPVSVADVVLGAVETLRPAMVAKEIAFEADVDRALAPIPADPSRLQQVVWNLLSNAIKFTAPGGAVHLRVGRAKPGVEIVVSDNGTGIPADFLPFVFDRFRQADAGPRRETSGLGLGLAIARHLVELHGGTITAESAGEGQGATFRVVLPGRQAPTDDSLSSG